MTITVCSYPATYRTAHHGGSGEQLPAYAVARDTKTGAVVEVTVLMFPGMSEGDLAEKAIAILRNRKRV